VSFLALIGVVALALVAIAALRILFAVIMVVFFWGRL
jgi:hypothetical protein